MLFFKPVEISSLCPEGLMFNGEFETRVVQSAMPLTWHLLLEFRAGALVAVSRWPNGLFCRCSLEKVS